MFIELTCMDGKTEEYGLTLINMDCVANCKKEADGGTALFNTMNGYFLAKESFDEIMLKIKEAS